MLSKKKSRNITVDGTQYQYIVTGERHDQTGLTICNTATNKTSEVNHTELDEWCHESVVPSMVSAAIKKHEL